jgi:HSP20 family protein
MKDNITRQDPWSVVPRLQDEINRLFGIAKESDSSSATAAWVPMVDIFEYANRFELFVDLPGVDPGQVALTLDGGVLTLAGNRTEQEIETQEKVSARRLERGLGAFHRRFVLPDTADGERVKASGKNGVLKVTIPKQERSMPRKIPIGAQ